MQTSTFFIVVRLCFFACLVEPSRESSVAQALSGIAGGYVGSREAPPTYTLSITFRPVTLPLFALCEFLRWSNNNNNNNDNNHFVAILSQGDLPFAPGSAAVRETLANGVHRIACARVASVAVKNDGSVVTWEPSAALGRRGGLQRAAPRAAFNRPIVS